MSLFFKNCFQKSKSNHFSKIFIKRYAKDGKTNSKIYSEPFADSSQLPTMLLQNLQKACQGCTIWRWSR